MGIIVLYILRELGVTFLFGFVAFTGLFLIVGLVQTALEQHVPLIHIWQLVPFVFAETLRYTLPITLLLAVTIFFARMSGNNEIIALKALGVPPRAFLLPVFVLAFIISLVGVGINELSVTWGPQGIKTVLERAAQDILIVRLKKERRFETGNKQLTIVVQGVDDANRLIEPTIMLKRESVTLEARTAQIEVDLNKEILTITLDEMRVVGGGGLRIIMPNRELQISLAEIVSIGKSDRPAEMGLDRISKEKRNATEQIERQRRIIAAHRTFMATMGSVNAWAEEPQIVEAKARIHSLQSHIQRLSVEPPRRWATGFCCFFFVWLGAPLAIWMKKSDTFSSFFACFIPILLLYYPLLALGLEQAKNGTLPPICVWTANVALGLIGLWFLRQIHRY